jgi:hypothetical protein
MQNSLQSVDGPLPGNYQPDECFRRAIVWLRQYEDFNPEDPPEWVADILNPPFGWDETREDNRKFLRFRAYKRCARQCGYTKRKDLPYTMVMAVRCRFPAPGNVYTGYISAPEKAHNLADMATQVHIEEWMKGVEHDTMDGSGRMNSEDYADNESEDCSESNWSNDEHLSLRQDSASSSSSAITLSEADRSSLDMNSEDSDDVENTDQQAVARASSPESDMDMPVSSGYASTEEEMDNFDFVLSQMMENSDLRERVLYRLSQAGLLKTEF